MNRRPVAYCSFSRAFNNYKSANSRGESPSPGQLAIVWPFRYYNFQICTVVPDGRCLPCTARGPVNNTGSQSGKETDKKWPTTLTGDSTMRDGGQQDMLFVGFMNNTRCIPAQEPQSTFSRTCAFTCHTNSSGTFGWLFVTQERRTGATCSRRAERRSRRVWWSVARFYEQLQTKTTSVVNSVVRASCRRC